MQHQYRHRCSTLSTITVNQPGSWANSIGALDAPPRQLWQFSQLSNRLWPCITSTDQYKVTAISSILPWWVASPTHLRYSPSPATSHYCWCRLLIVGTKNNSGRQSINGKYTVDCLTTTAGIPDGCEYNCAADTQR